MLVHIISTTPNRTDRNWWYSDFVLWLPNFGLLAFGPENFQACTNCHGLFFFLQSVVTPIGFLFWTLFSESPFGFDPNVHVTTWFSIGALIFMVPAIFVYNTGWVTVRPLFIVTFQNHVRKFLTNARIFVLIVQILERVLCSKFSSSEVRKPSLKHVMSLLQMSFNSSFPTSFGGALPCLLNEFIFFSQWSYCNK